MEPLLSVIIPVKDEDRLLEDAHHVLMELQSTLAGVEILVIDDGSSWSFVQKIQEWQVLIPNLRVYRAPGSGLGSARNAGLDLARGKYVFFLDFDDAVCFEPFRECLRLLESSSADFLHFGEQRFKLMSREIFGDADTNVVVRELSSKDLLRRWAAAGFWDSSICHQISRRESFFTPALLRFPTSGFYEDSSLKTKYLLSDFRCLTTEKKVYLRRVREDSMTGSPPQLFQVIDFAKSLWLGLRASFTSPLSIILVVAFVQVRRFPYLLKLLFGAMQAGDGTDRKLVRSK